MSSSIEDMPSELLESHQPRGKNLGPVVSERLLFAAGIVTGAALVRLTVTHEPLFSEPLCSPLSRAEHERHSVALAG